MRPIQVGNLTLDGSRLFLIAGPCVIESYERTLMIGREIKKICERLGVQYIFKASYDKANRSSLNHSAVLVWKKAWKSWPLSRRNCRYRFFPMYMM